MRAVVTDGVVVRHYFPSLSSKAPDRYKAHLAHCRYAASATETMYGMIERMGEDKARIKVLIGIVEPCGVCKPVLIGPDDGEPPIYCRYCHRQSDPEVAYYGPGNFRLCDDCAREAAEELGQV